MSLTTKGTPSARYQRELAKRRGPTKVAAEPTKRAPRRCAERRLKEPKPSAPARAFPLNTAPVVYIVRARKLGLVKIGFAADLVSRLNNLRVGSADELDLVAVIRSERPKELEQGLHARFAMLRSHGEWFHCSPELVDLITLNSAEVYFCEERNGLRAILEPAAGSVDPR